MRFSAPFLLVLFIVMAGADQAIGSENNEKLVQLPFRSGDALRVIVHPDTVGFPNGIYFIDGSGYADLPVVGRIPVVGRASEEISEFLKTEWADYLRYPNVQTRPMVRINLLGGFYRPGLYCIDPSLSMWNAVFQAGGPVRSDGFRKMTWERGGKVVRKDLVSLLESGKSLYEIGFVTGDQIRVTNKPERGTWDIVRQDIIPTLTLFLSVTTTSLALYNTYKR